MAIWLVGAGKMAKDYARVLDALEVTYTVIGRSEPSALAFEKVIGRPVRIGGIENALALDAAPEEAIVAVSVDQLAITATELIRSGTKRILLEKPAGLNLTEISRLNETADRHGAEVAIGYNRRFYGSVQLAREFIHDDGGALSAQFEFTEWSHVVARSNQRPEVKERWLIANSSHVIDTVFHLIGRPESWNCISSGYLDWHPAAARFSGVGMSEENVMFSYIADWQAPGRWGIELLTSKRRLILRPMEQLNVIELGSTEVKRVDRIDEVDLLFKPGLYRQAQAFFDRDDTLFCSLNDQLSNAILYSKMAGY